jgi:acyl-CoA synthetase (AMP-forming)/AMP-acid ligase II
LLSNAARHAEAVGLRADDTVLVNLPLYYSYAIVAQACAALVTGARLVVAGPPFAPRSYYDAIARHEVTSSSITPTIARHLLAKGHRPTRRPRLLTVGGDRLPGEQVTGLLTANLADELYVTYGLTEAGPRVTTLAAHREPARRHGSVGTPLRGVRTSLNRSDTQPDVGELLVESDTVLLRKIGSPARQTLLAPGLITTGDLFHIDEDGYHFFRGRRSDFVVINGEKVSLDAVRQAVLAIPGVLNCLPRLRTDDSGEPYFDIEVQVTDPDQVRPQTIRGHLNSMLLRGERPREIVVVAADAVAFRK